MRNFYPESRFLYFQCEDRELHEKITREKIDAIIADRPFLMIASTGHALAMGAVLLAAGSAGKRYALPNARIMIHQPLAGMQGTAEEIMIHAKEFKNIKKRLNDILIRHTGQPLEKIESDTDRDRFMTAIEAKEYSLIDLVIESIDGKSK